MSMNWCASPNRPRQMLAERLHAEPLGRVMSGGDEGDARLAREVDVLLRDLAGHVRRRRRARSRSRRSPARRRCTTPRAPRPGRCLADDERLATEPLLHLRHEPGEIGRRVERAVGDELLLAGASFDGEPEPRGKLRVVAELRMQIERQVVGEEAEAGAEQELDPPLARPDEPRILALPEVAVMDKQRVGAAGGGALDERTLAVTPETSRAISGRPSTCNPFGQ